MQRERREMFLLIIVGAVTLYLIHALIYPEKY
ncbi:potassium-transporting ATPase subunit F [Peribacillus simplex]|nr:potassium-transporting ATPase subunit F [Peribacillus simplex]NCT38275.1 potassium-transporting ATPase subunit F [Peribacillus frigoritolerans]